MKAPRRDVPAEQIAELAAAWAAYRLGGCPSGFYEPFRRRAGKIAQQHGQSFAELWQAVHKAAYILIDADPRSRLSSQKD